MFAGNTIVKSSDRLYISFNISSWIEHRTNTSNLSPIIKKAQHNWNICAISNMIKSCFPLPDPFTRSGRRNHKDQIIILMKLLN